MNESGLSKYLIGHLQKRGLFTQRLEVTTGAGVPDLVAMGSVPHEDPSEEPYHLSKTFWIELKWKTKHIRPEQYIWGQRALKAGINVNYIVGYEDQLELYSIKNAEKMTNSWKLTTLINEQARSPLGVRELTISLM